MQASSRPDVGFLKLVEYLAAIDHSPTPALVLGVAKQMQAGLQDTL